MRMKIAMRISSIVIEVIRTVFFFYEIYFKCNKHKQKYLNNIQPNMSKQKKNKQKHPRNIQPDISKEKKRKQKHLSNF